MKLQLAPFIFAIFLITASYYVLPVAASPCAILKVSLPAGFYYGYDADPWLCQSYILNLTGSVQTFVVRINNTSTSLRSYDTRLVIALNEAGYNNLVSLVVNGTNVPKTSFKWGTPKPYNRWIWPSGDVYPTWFNDTLVNVGTIGKRSYVALVVSVNFLNASGVRMHFDAYGKSTFGSVTSDSQIVHNPNSEDSTVLFQTGPPPPQPPIASFTFTPTYPETNQIVTFDASSSYDPDGYIVSYAWNFGDGNVTLTSNPVITHAYTSFGDYIVTLTVTDNSGLTDDATATVHVSQHPVASFTFSPPDPLMHEIVTFDASASSPDGGAIVSFTWNFGDGNITTISEPVITHAYETWGTYTVTLNVTDSEGKWDTETKQIIVENAPVADFTWDPYLPRKGETVTFDASISSPDGGVIIGYTWDFGDGTPIVEENDPVITHVYAAAGEYLVTLNVTDSEGRWDTETKQITVAPIYYYLEVKTDPEGITTIPGENWYNEGSEVTLTAPETVPISTGARYKFSYWDVDGIPRGIGIIQITVLMDVNHTATAHYLREYYLTVSSPFGIVSGEGWYQDGSTAYASLNTGIVDHGNGTRRVFTSWGGDASGTNYAQSDPIIMDSPKTATANWKTQYYIEVSSLYGSPSPASGWFDAGSSITASVNSPISGPTGTRYVCTGWTGTGSVPPSGTGASVIFTLDAPSSITWNWKTQYLLTVVTNPAGLSPQPTRNPAGEAGPTNGWWYDAATSVSLTAQAVTDYTFNYWDVDGASQGSGVNPIAVVMNAPHTATAHYAYTPPPPPLSVSISPPSASIRVGQSVNLTSTVSGGTQPYSYQWYLNGTAVGGATSDRWTFSPSSSGTYIVYLRVTDKDGNTAQSNSVTVKVSPPVAVGGYTFSLAAAAKVPVQQLTVYVTIIAFSSLILVAVKRKRK